MEVFLAEDIEQLREHMKNKSIVVLGNDKSLYEIFQDEELRKLPRNLKLNAKVCNQVMFKDGVDLYVNNVKINTFYNLFELLKALNETDKGVYVSIKSNDNKELFEILQQLINLRIDLDVYKDEDISRNKSVVFFRTKHKELKAYLLSFDNTLKYIDSHNLNSIEELKKSIIESIEKSIKEIDRIEKPIKVAVFATKKSGKSMVVNCLLNEEYAPTSLELATPNVLVYKPYRGDKIKLVYEDQELEFEKPENIKEFIRKIYEDVNLQGRALGDMTIYYPATTGHFYEVYDTPGPDLAGSEHRDIYEKVLPHIDVSIFLIDYTKYAQDTEMKLFEDIKKEFEKLQKNHTFICLINKIDTIFQDESAEKVTVRIADFMENKLKSLGYSNFVVIPISAMMYFYTNKIASRYQDIMNCKDVVSFLQDLVKRDDIRNDETYRTFIRNVQNLANNIYDMHNRDITYNDLIKFTNMDFLIKYLNFVIQNKADIEKTWSIIASIDSSINNVFNNLNIRRKTLKQHIEEIKKAFDDFMNGVYKDIERNIEDNVIAEIDKMKYEIYDNITVHIFFAIKENKQRHEVKISSEINNAKVDIAKYIEDLKAGEMDINVFDYIVNERIKMIKVDIELIKDTFLNKELFIGPIKNKTQKINEELSILSNNFKESISKLNQQIKNILSKDIVSETGDIIETPSIDISFNITELLADKIESFNYTIYTQNTIDQTFFSEVIKGGVLRWIASLFGGSRYEVDVPLIFSKIDEMKANLSEKFESYFDDLENKMNVIRDEIMSHITAEIDNRKLIIHDFFKSVGNIIEEIRRELDDEYSEREKILEFVDIALNSYDAVSKVWKEIVTVGKL